MDAPGNGDTDAAMAFALKLLGLRLRSEAEIRDALQRKTFSADAVEATFVRLQALGYVDDARFARGRALALLQSARLGPEKVVAKLRGHGLDEHVAQKALAEAREELGASAVAEEDVARKLLERKWKGHPPTTATERVRDFRFLIARGFSEDVARKVLGISDEEER